MNESFQRLDEHEKGKLSIPRQHFVIWREFANTEEEPGRGKVKNSTLEEEKLSKATEKK